MVSDYWRRAHGNDLLVHRIPTIAVPRFCGADLRGSLGFRMVLAYGFHGEPDLGVSKSYTENALS